MPELKLNGKTYSGSTNYASAITYTEDDGSKTTIQDKISELNSNIDEQNKNINTLNTNKADKTTVEALSKNKADKTTVEALSENKADKSELTTLSNSLKWKKIDTKKTFTNTASITVGTYSQLKSAKEVIVVFSDDGGAQEVHKHLINTGTKVYCEYQILTMNGYMDTYWNYSRTASAQIDFSSGKVIAQQVYKGDKIGAYSGIKAIYYR